MIGLLDGDIFAFRLACVLSPDIEQGDVFQRMSDYVSNVTVDAGIDEFRMFLSPPTKNVFRTEFYPEYKANRKSTPKPFWLGALREFLINEYKAECVEPYEADDLLGIAQSEDSIIVSMDKDLMQIPGNHYNLKHKTFSYVSEDDAYINYLTQCITGDRTDNIFGVPRMGPTKARKWLERHPDIHDRKRVLHDICDLYSNRSDFLNTARCVWIVRNLGEFSNPDLKELHDSIQEDSGKE